MMRKVISCAIAIALLAGVTAHAHHSYAATYDTSKEVKVTGKLVQFSYKNPHSYVTIQSADAKGAVQRWSVEWAGSSQLSNRGVTQDTLKINDQIVIIGRPSRVPGEFKMLLVNLTRPSDGFQWGTSTGDKVE
jgi:hypothetical protein